MRRRTMYCFAGTEPVFVDVLSFERRAAGLGVWPACGHFVRTFLLPMLACSRLGWPLASTMVRRAGYEPEEIYHNLAWRSAAVAPRAFRR